VPSTEGANSHERSGIPQKVLLNFNGRLESRHIDGAPKEQVSSSAWHESLRYQGQGERHPSTFACLMGRFGSTACITRFE
jgi:hypothetical protein